jgi:uncharacterized membrane protein SpoIIM required for sporulation
VIDVERWAAEREDRWQELAALLATAETAAERELGSAGIRRLVSLYRQVASDLSQARSLTANPELLGRLNNLAGRGYRFIYRARRPLAQSLGELARRLARLLASEIPAAFQREAAAVAAAAGALVLGALFGATAMVVRPAAAQDLIPGPFFTESPRARVEQIERRTERIATVAQAAVFSSQLYTHNIQVAFLVFSLGALTFAGALPLVFYNGVLIGAVAARYALDGVSVFFFAWVGPHGAFELTAIAFSAAAGMVAGRALLLPGERSRGAALRLAFPRVGRMMSAVVLLLVVAGMIEGSFSQFSAKTVPYPLKIVVAAVLLASLLLHLFLPRRPAPGGSAPAAAPAPEDASTSERRTATPATSGRHVAASDQNVPPAGGAS